MLIVTPSTPTNQSVVFQCFIMTKDVNGKCFGNVSFNILDGNKNIVGSKLINIEQTDWNNFWTNFNSGTDLYKLYDPNATEQEGDFTN